MRSKRKHTVSLLTTLFSKYHLVVPFPCRAVALYGKKGNVMPLAKGIQGRSGAMLSPRCAGGVRSTLQGPSKQGATGAKQGCAFRGGLGAGMAFSLGYRGKRGYRIPDSETCYPPCCIAPGHVMNSMERLDQTLVWSGALGFTV